MPSEDQETIEIFNVNRPGTSSFVKRKYYDAMKTALIAMLSAGEDAMTQTQMQTGILPYLSQEIFPKGEKSGWWLKAVQLDLEARHVLVREKGTPNRWRRNAETGEIKPEKAVPAKRSPHPVHVMPEDVRNRLIASRLWDAYEGRPYYQRNDYIGWILDAKREETREKRTVQMLEELRDGDRYMNMAIGSVSRERRE